MGTIDDILNKEPAEEVAEVTEPENVGPEPKAEEQPRDETGKFAAKGEEESASPAPEAEEPPFDHAAVKGERTRRQEAERKLSELEEQLKALQSPPPPPEDPASLWEDEEKWQAQFGSKIASQAALNSRLDMSEMLARREHKEDFDQMKETFIKLANDNPALGQQALNDPDPWEKAYQIAKNHATMQELGATDLASMKEKIREELMAEMAATTPVTRQSVPPTLSGERNVGDRKGPEWGGPKPLSELLG
ncbi:hypothetical protein [Sphingorhabdus sp. SMR4y]|uniref:hypothetical protein n=1 Tax=Sphingorhabdus sp. SMR4y TaxID=2584094 RepID=UPI000B5C3267|nr:hypothetical protein [Sphingorhabdus sp. SMR4y]ASK88467.1 hypothetical protein SPHFLASMR4Y_01720 [Sphingorhabdus sp. SMR4y]